jgi:uncharacterized protein YecT (DUF1311 family)
MIVGAGVVLFIAGFFAYSLARYRASREPAINQAVVHSEPASVSSFVNLSDDDLKSKCFELSRGGNGPNRGTFIPMDVSGAINCHELLMVRLSGLDPEAGNRRFSPGDSMPPDPTAAESAGDLSKLYGNSAERGKFWAAMEAECWEHIQSRQDTIAERHRAIWPSFDCRKAKSAVEMAICEDASLATLDASMAEAYKAKLTRLNGPDKLQLQADHKRWFKEYASTCNVEKENDERLSRCIEKLLKDRITELK